MTCWICSASEGNTGEHSVKRSDLQRIFGKRGTFAPSLFRRSDSGSEEVPNLDSDLLKFDTKICGTCNNNRTQGNDDAWKTLSKALGSISTKAGEVIDLRNIFKKDTHREMTKVHLYFIKILGCAILDQRLKIDLKPFSDALMQQTYDPSVYLSFGIFAGLDPLKYAAHSRVGLDGDCAAFIYTASPISVEILHSGPGSNRQGMVRSWHPLVFDDRLHIKGFGGF